MRCRCSKIQRRDRASRLQQNGRYVPFFTYGCVKRVDDNDDGRSLKRGAHCQLIRRRYGAKGLNGTMIVLADVYAINKKIRDDA